LFSNRPEDYADKIIKDLGINKIPINEKEIADALGYRIKKISNQETSPFKDIDEILNLSPAHLLKQYRLILVKDDMLWTRKRSSIFHELGHAVIPWHSNISYSCSEKDLDPKCSKIIERQAFSCGMEFMMPSNLFIADINSLPIGIETIKKIANRYEASLEATAIRYAKLSQNICAIVVMEPKENQQTNFNHSKFSPEYQLELASLIPFNSPNKEEEEMKAGEIILRVKYFVKSSRFPKYIYIKPGTEIGWGNPITKAWIEEEHVQTEIPASLFGFSSRMNYMAECFPLGKTGKIMVFLWIPDRQQLFKF
jgi:Zn-dependent peptidase ImmA (M78 family)